MAVQLNSPYYDGLTAQQTVSRLLQSLSDGSEKESWYRQQYWSPVGSAAWKRTQLARQVAEVLAGMGWEAVIFFPAGLIFIGIIMLLLSLPFVRHLLLRTPPKNPLVHCDFARQCLKLSYGGKETELTLGKASCLMQREEPLFLSGRSKLLILEIYDHQAKAHRVMEIETAALGGQTDPRFLEDTERLGKLLTEKLNIKRYAERL